MGAERMGGLGPTSGETLDLAVVGGGIVGATAAYLAALRQPDWRVLLLERSLVGAGATQYSGGHNHPFGHSPAQKEMSARSLEIFDELRARIPDLPLFECPFFGIVSREALERTLDGFVHGGVHEAGPEELQALRAVLPGLALGPEQVVLTGGHSGYGFPARIADAFASELRKLPRGGLWEGVEIADVQRAGPGGAYELATADGRRLRARRVVVTTGPWALQGPASGTAVQAGVRIKKVAALHVERVPPPGAPIVYFFDDDAYLLPIAERSQWVLSFASPEWDVTPDFSRLRIDARDRRIGTGILARYCRAFAEDCHGGRVFCDAYVPDRVPVHREVQPDFVVAGAGSGFGFRLAPCLAERALHALSGFAVSASSGPER